MRRKQALEIWRCVVGKIIASMFTSIDGYIEGRNKELDFFVGTISDRSLDEATSAMLDNASTIVAGSGVYESLVHYWPTDASKNDVYAEKMNTLPKLIFSHSHDAVEWGTWDNARLATRSIPAEVAALREASDKDIVVFGGPSIIHAFREEGLIDEYRMQVCPKVLGGGTPYFKDVDAMLGLMLVSAIPHPSGVVELRYATGDADRSYAKSRR
jgi:dihydrofolate reductase